MNERKFYPKRTDHVFAVQFDGALESAVATAQTAGCAVELLIDPRIIGCQLRIGQRIIAVGEYVVCDQSKNIIDVVDGRDFHNRYSSDGS